MAYSLGNSESMRQSLDTIIDHLKILLNKNKIRVLGKVILT